MRQRRARRQAGGPRAHHARRGVRVHRWRRVRAARGVAACSIAAPSPAHRHPAPPAPCDDGVGAPRDPGGAEAQAAATRTRSLGRREGEDRLLSRAERRHRRRSSSCIGCAASLKGVIICGIKDIGRAIITQKEEGEKTAAERAADKPAYRLLVEGVGLQAVIGIAGVRGEQTRSTHVAEVEKVFGIEAARTTIAGDAVHDVAPRDGHRLAPRLAARRRDDLPRRGARHHALRRAEDEAVGADARVVREDDGPASSRPPSTRAPTPSSASPSASSWGSPSRWAPASSSAPARPESRCRSRSRSSPPARQS